MQTISLRLQGLKDGCLSESLPRGAFARLKGKERKAVTQVCARSTHNNSHTVATSRTHWQTSFSIISSNAQQQQTVSKEAPMEEEDDAILLPSPVNGKPCALQSTILEQNQEKENMKIMAKQKKPLTLIEDFLPPPAHGSQIRVAYQGVSGAYSESAANKAYPGCDAVPCEEFEGAFKAVELWIADRAVMPVENSLGGSIHRNYDLLLRHRLHIVGEVQLPVNHCLLAMPGVRKEQLKRIISHPQALSQCEHTLTSMLGTMGSAVSREAFYDTAGAAEYVAMKGLRDTAAIASMKAAETYGLNVLGEGIQDDPSNVTRFVMLARDPIIPRTDRPFKTSIVFANEEEANGNGTSCLFKVLSAFAFRNISLTKIESRPHRNKPLRVVDDEVNTLEQGQARHFEYMFYVDFEASMAEPRSQNALSDVLEFTSFLRVLGSYPMDMTPLSFSTPPK